MLQENIFLVYNLMTWQEICSDIRIIFLEMTHRLFVVCQRRTLPSYKNRIYINKEHHITALSKHVIAATITLHNVFSFNAHQVSRKFKQQRETFSCLTLLLELLTSNGGIAPAVKPITAKL